MSLQQKVSSFPPIDLDNNPDIERIRVASQTTRLQILNLLLSPRTKKLYPTEMERLLHVPRRVVSFHLNALEEVGLVQSEFGLSQDKRPQAVRYYTATAEGKVTFERITHMLKKHH
jgi:DNA-binding transcriptional ArsR family regulator